MQLAPAKPTKRKTYTVVVDEAVMARVDELAASSNVFRSRAQFAEYALKRALAELDRQDGSVNV